MHKTKVLSLVLALTVLPMAGCIENMSDLKDRLGATDAEGIDQSATNTTGEDGLLPTNSTQPNATKPEFKPPVARITVFAEGGALAFRSSFVAENQTDAPIIVAPGVLTLVAADSEAVEPGAELSTFTWTVDGVKSEGRKLDANISEPGIHMVELVVTDSKGSADGQMIHLGVVPEPYDVSEAFEGQLLLSVLGTPDEEGMSKVTHAFKVLAEDDGKEVTAKSLKVTLVWGTVDTSYGAELEVFDAAGTSIGTGSTSVNVDAPAAGDYTVVYRVPTVNGPTDYTITVTTTYVQVVEGLEGDGHAHAH